MNIRTTEFPIAELKPTNKLPPIYFSSKHTYPKEFASAIALPETTMVKTLPFADIQVSTPGFGAMGLSFGLGSNLSLEEAEPVLLKAIELGCTFWDTAVCSFKKKNPLEDEFYMCLEIANANCVRSSIKLESTRSCWEISSGSTTCETRSSVRFGDDGIRVYRIIILIQPFSRSCFKVWHQRIHGP